MSALRPGQQLRAVRRADPERVTVVPARHRRDRADAPAASGPRRSGIADGVPLFVNVARLVPEKAQHLLVDRHAFAEVRACCVCPTPPSWSTPTSSRTPTTSSARSPIPRRWSAGARSSTCSNASTIARRLGSTALSLWLADGTNYPGQDDLVARRRRMLEALGEVYAAQPAEQELLVEYKLFEPAFYATDLADWGSALLVCQKLGERARVLVDLGHHAQGTNVEQIVALLGDEDRLGGFHFNNRKYADDDLIVGSVNPFELFLIFCELVGSGRRAAAPDHRPGAQRRGEGGGHGPQRRQPPGGLRQGAARGPRGAGRRRRAGRRARRSRGAARRLPQRRAPAVRAGARGGRRRRGPDRRAPRLGLPRADHRRARGGGHGGRGVGAMSTVAGMIANAEDRWPSDGEVPSDTLGQVLLASQLLGSDRAVANFGGGNTSAKGRATDHVGREVDVMWVKGSGSDLATMGAEHFTPLRLDEMLVLFERAEMSDEDMVAHLARCQTDPAAPRASIETLLHAFVPAAHVHHTHPDAINVLAGTRDGERLVHECFGDEAAWIPYIRPGFALARQVGVAVRENPGLRLVVLAKHGLVVWGDSVQEAYRRTLEAINQAADFVNARTAGTPRFGGPAADDGDALDDEGRREVLRAVLPALRGVVSSERAKVLVVDTSERALQFVGSAGAADLVTVGAACPDHLVHTKRLPLWIPFDPARDDTDTLVARIGERAEALPGRLPGVRRGVRRRDDRARRPRRAGRPDPARRVGRRGADPEERAPVTGPLPPGDRGDGRRPRARRLHLAGCGRELRRRVLAAGALQAVACAGAR